MNTLNGWGEMLIDGMFRYREVFARYPEDRHSAILTEVFLRISPGQELFGKLRISCRHISGPPIEVAVFNGSYYVPIGEIKPKERHNFSIEEFPIKWNCIFPDGWNVRAISPDNWRKCTAHH